MVMDLSFGLGVLALGTRGFCALGWGYICLCLLFVWGGSSVLPSFQGLEVDSYSPHRAVGGDQSLETFSGINLIYFFSMG